MSARILIVDDEKDLADLVELMLRKAKIDAVCRRVGTGGEAVSACRAEQPNLVLLDVALPDVPGLEVLRRLKADPATASIPVVIVTAMRGDILADAAKGGAAGTLLKPFKKAELVQVVTTALGPSGT